MPRKQYPTTAEGRFRMMHKHWKAKLSQGEIHGFKEKRTGEAKFVLMGDSAYSCIDLDGLDALEEHIQACIAMHEKFA